MAKPRIYQIEDLQNSLNVANTAYAAANAAANTVAVYADGTLSYANANINFNNSATINVSISQNTTNKFANVTLNVNTSLFSNSTGANLIGFIQGGTNAVSRTLQTKLREGWISVKDFGAVGDGSANDTIAVQDAINYANTLGGGVVYFPEGTYNLSIVTYQPGITFQGEGGNSKLFKIPATNSFSRMFTAAGTGYNSSVDSKPVIWRDLYFDGNSSNQTPYNNYEKEHDHIIFLTANTVNPGRLRAFIERCVFENCVADAVSVYTNVNLEISDCIMSKCFRGSIVCTGGWSIIKATNIHASGSGDQFSRIDIETDGAGYNGSNAANLNFSNIYTQYGFDLTGETVTAYWDNITTELGSMPGVGSIRPFGVTLGGFGNTGDVVITNSKLVFGEQDGSANRIYQPKFLKLENCQLIHQRDPASSGAKEYGQRIYWGANNTVIFQDCDIICDDTIQSTDTANGITSLNNSVAANNLLIVDSCRFVGSANGFDTAIYLRGGNTIIRDTTVDAVTPIYQQNFIAEGGFSTTGWDLTIDNMQTTVKAQKWMHIVSTDSNAVITHKNTYANSTNANVTTDFGYSTVKFRGSKLLQGNGAPTTTTQGFPGDRYILNTPVNNSPYDYIHMGYSGGSNVWTAVLSDGSANASNIIYTPAGTGANVRTVQSALRDRVSVFDFMTAAQITDVTTNAFSVDCTAAINTAIAYAATTGKDLYVPAGTYRIVPNLLRTYAGGTSINVAFDMVSNMSIVAEEGATFKIANNVSTTGSPVFMAMFFTRSQLSNLKFYGLTMDMNGANNRISPSAPSSYNRFNQAMIFVSGGSADAYCNDVLVERCNFLNTPGVSCIVMAQTATYTNETLGKNWTIRDCLFKNNGLDSDDHSSIYAWAENVIVEGCTFTADTMFPNGTVAGGSAGSFVACEIHGKNHRFTNNLVENYFQGLWVASNTSKEANNIIINHNTFAPIQFAAIDFFRFSSAETAVRDVIISDNVFGIEDTVPSGSVPDLKTAVQIASWYAIENVQIINNIARKTGTNKSSAFFNLAASNIALTNAKTNNIIMRGNYLEGFSLGVAISAVTNPLGYIEISDNTMMNCTPTAVYTFPQGIGISANTTSTKTIDHLVLDGNAFIDNRVSPSFSFGVYINPEVVITTAHVYNQKYKGMTIKNFSNLGTISNFFPSANYEVSLADYGDLANAINSGANTIFVPKGTYSISSVQNYSLSRSIKIYGEGTFSWGGSSQTDSMINFTMSADSSISIEGLTFDGANTVAGGVRIEGTSAQSTTLGYGLVQNCTFRNFRALASSSRNFGLCFIGSFDRVNIRNNAFRNITRAASGGASPLAATQACLVLDNRTVSPNRYCRYAVHENNSYYNISSSETSTSTNNYDHDGFVYFAPYPGTSGAPTWGTPAKDKYADATFLSQGNYYHNCRGRAIKAQAYGVVKDEIIVRDGDYTNYTGFSEIAFQYGIGTASDIEFHYTDYSNGTNSPFIAANNNVLVDFYTAASIGGVSPLGATAKNLKIFWNIQDGVGNNISAIVSAWYRPTTPNHQVLISDVIMNRGQVDHIAIGGLANDANVANGYAQIVMQNIVVDRVKYGGFGNIYLDYPTNGTVGNTTFLVYNVKSRDGLVNSANAKYMSVYRGTTTYHDWYLGSSVAGDNNFGWLRPPLPLFTANSASNVTANAMNASNSATSNTRTTQSKMRDFVSVADFGAVGDGVTDDTAAIQRAINYCYKIGATTRRWPTLLITGNHYITRSLVIDRFIGTTAFDTMENDFVIMGLSEASGFYGSGTGLTFFDSTLSMTTDPVSERITFEKLQFRTVQGNASTIISKKFLRIRFHNCFFLYPKLVNTDSYIQSLHLKDCVVQQAATPFITCYGLYDVTVDDCDIVNSACFLQNIVSSRGANSLRITNCDIEGSTSDSFLKCHGASGVVIENNYFENDLGPIFDFSGGDGSVNNKSITLSSNFIVLTASGPFARFGSTGGRTKAVISFGNSVVASSTYRLYDGIASVDNFSSVSDWHQQGSTYLSDSNNGYYAYDNNIGINTRTPTSNLHVVGTANITSNVSITGQINLLSGQIKFPASANASSDVNTLDDYEEGIWYPEIKGTGGGAYTMAASGSYTKIGREVTVHATIQWTGRTTPYSGLFSVYGLPFPNNSGQRCSGCMAGIESGMRFSSTAYTQWQVIVDPNNSFAYILEAAADGDGYTHTPTVDATGLIYGFTLTYFV